MKHTPTPYLTEDIPLEALPPRRWWCVFTPKRKGLVAMCERSEDALFIKEACNAHERLKRDYKIIANERTCLKSANKTLQRERDALLEASIKLLKEIDEFVQWREPGYPPENTGGLKEAVALCKEGGK